MQISSSGPPQLAKRYFLKSRSTLMSSAPGNARRLFPKQASLPQAPPVAYIKASGGIFRDMLIHDLDIFRWILER
jgi:myo-inositol 2-dehydrogenase / D-chiro-inositol 1-dehydrogenase